MKDVLGNDFYNDLIEIKNDIQLDRTIFGYFYRCFLVNTVLAKYNFFLKFFEQRDIYRFQIKKKVESKNTVRRNLSSSVLEKFNGYEIIRHELACQEKREFVPIDIVYEPVYDESIPAPCFFTDQIFLAYRNYICRIEKGKEQILHRTVKQCHYCENYFAKNDDTMKKHLQVCAAKEGITYSFDNGQIITFQDNFRYLGGVPFTVYFDFEKNHH